ncbi:unnamed protein product [Rotaria socialis]|uniref:Uncharacterized protein n=2 Tax=Rotaria socialis TaxID=392032 RepID=A0A820YPI2_9BILA|nr:unnamed protein product [Rotaria socialis]CAF4309496.1 unnamed protein product [Rotaria socialis]CAF4549538.1 unnamed protein product [Rotaria socialis]CAF4601246.1 unnamed protein product [Rotaria socialis]
MQLIPFCMRSLDSSCNTSIYNVANIIHGTPIKFETLQRENITSQQLYLWFAFLDLIERYQAFLEKLDSSLLTRIFYNCSQLWFGEYCQYTLTMSRKLNDMILNRIPIDFHPMSYLFGNGTCYTYLKCDRGPAPSCLDWRKICDGKIDCLDGGSDEASCDVLDINEYKKDEFQCGSGLCIPKDFCNDDPYMVAKNVFPGG